MNTQSIPQTKPLVHIRAGKGEWLCVGFLALFFGVPFLILLRSSHVHSIVDVFFMALAALFLFSIPLFFATLSFWTEVIAGETGLRWRRWLKWRQCSWEDVTDYYLEQYSNSSGKRALIIKTTLGKIWLGPASLDSKPLIPVVQQYATHAKATEWAILGARPADWPRTFDYQTSDNRMAPYFLWGGAAMLVCLGYIIGPKISTLAGPGALWSWIALGVMLLMMAGMILLVVALTQPVARMYRERRLQRITVDRNGIVYEDSSGRMRASWADVVDYYIAPYRMGLLDSGLYVLETRSGKFDFTLRIANVRVLSAIIEKECTGVPAPGWRKIGPDTEDISAKAGSWAQARDQARGQRFTYRTRFNRVSLVGLTALGLVWPLVIAVERLTGLPAINAIPILIFSFIWLLASAWMWSRYLRGCIGIDDDGITKEGPFGSTRLLWPDITEYREVGGDVFVFCVVTAGGRRLSFWLGISRAKELKAEIAKRAVNSKTKGWEK